MDNNHLPSLLVSDEKGVKSFNDHQGSYDEDGDSFELRSYISIVLKRKWWIITTVAIALIFVTYLNMKQIPLFRGTSTLQIIQDNPSSFVSSERSRDIESGLLSIDRFYETQYKLLGSRAVAYRIIEAMNLLEHPEYKSLLGDSKQSSREKERTLADIFRNSLEISPIKNSYLVDISYKSADPDLAMRVPNEICKEYLKFCMETRSQSYILIREWLEIQLLQLAGKVETSEKKLLDHGRKDDFMGLEGDDNVIVKKYVELNRVLTSAQADRMNKESQYRQIKEQGADAPLIANNPLIMDLRREIITAKAKVSSQSPVYGKNHPQMQGDLAKIAELNSRMNSEVKRTLNTVRADYEIALRTESFLKEAADSQKNKVGKLQDGLVKYNILKRDMATGQQLYEALLARMKEASVASTMVASNAVAIDTAELPLAPFSPNKAKNVAFALFFGLAGGIGLAFLVEHLDSSIKSVAELEKVYRIPSLGIIPLAAKIQSVITDDKEVGLEIISQPKSMLSEAIHHIQASVMLSLSGRPPKTLMVCSANPGEGKSSLSTSLAASLAMRDNKVVLMDIDLRKPSLSKIFQLPQQPGLSNFLSGGASLAEIIHPTSIPNLFLIPAGNIPPNPIPLLASPDFADLLKDLSQDFQNIIIDTPPVIGFADARMIASLMDGVLMVFKHHSTSLEAGRLGVQLLNKANARILGGVLNMVQRRKLGYGGYYYGYYRYYSRYYKSYNSDQD
ncbi:MAG: GumC family protein [Desulfobaccales bacterium]